MKNILDIINEEIEAVERQEEVLNEILDSLEGLDDSSPNLPLYGDHLKSISEEPNNFADKIQTTNN